MKKKFKAELHAGHQEDAVEVPFDPVEVWGIAPGPLWRGRKGHRVLATVNGIKFAGFIVSRQRKSFLLIDEDIKQEAGVAVGDIVSVTLQPTAGTTK
ncbi:MAG TPA: DUF1905 domain-containing protein [Pyrinomonadaceae bacterium]|jgi:hypothetical protein|nr:DUF1905 domain-containing protein [Pyrinomonadaceae bacterium]